MGYGGGAENEIQLLVFTQIYSTGSIGNYIHKTKTIIISDGMADFNITQNTHTQLI